MKVQIYKASKLDTAKLPRDENGKPLPIKLTDGKLLHFNISHSGDYVAIVTSSHPVGIDLQNKFKQGKPRELSKRALKKILKPGEKPVNGNYLHNFVIKEAYSKKIGVGLPLGFSTIDANDLLKKPHYYKETTDYICYAF